MVVRGMAASSYAPVMVRRRMPPSADFRMPQAVPPRALNNAAAAALITAAAAGKDRLNAVLGTLKTLAAPNVP